MGSLPTAARTYILAIWMLGAFLSVCLCRAPDAFARFDLWEWVLLLPLSIAIAGKKITVGGKQDSGDAMTVSLSFVAVFTCLLWLGPFGGLLAAILGSLTTCVVRRSQPAYQIAFNVALSACEAWAAERILDLVGGGAEKAGELPWLLSIPLAGAAMFAVSSIGVGIVVALCTRSSAVSQVRSVVWALPSYVAGTSVAAVGTLLFHESGMRTSVGGMVLFLAPVSVLAFQAYRIYVSREDERHKRIEDLQRNQDRLAELYLATIRSLALAIDAKDKYTHQHILRVQRYAMAIAREVGLQGNDLTGLETGALLHDIGKLGVPEYILLKPGPLTEEEFDKVKKHPEIGAAILDPVPFPWPVLPVVKYHHEKWDGSGYPEGLRGEEIPLTARILSVADVYDALTSSRSYRSAWTHERALSHILENSGTHFDPALTAAFEKVVGTVIEALALEGQGPLALEGGADGSQNKADVAARHIKRASSELWELYEVAETLGQGKGLNDSLAIFAEKLASFRPGSTCVLVCRDDLGTPIVQHTEGPHRFHFEGTTPGRGEGPTFGALERGTTYRGSFVAEDFQEARFFGAEVALQSALVVPIVHQNTILGTINLYHASADAFSGQDEQFLERVAERVGVAIFQGAEFARTQSDALTDPLTGLHNIRHLQNQLALHCRNNKPFAVLCLDLDDFKPINDTFGHARGDDVLREVGALLRGSIRADDTVVRYGGDEFVILLLGIDPEGAHQVARSVEERIRAYNPGLTHVSRGAMRVGASVGLSCFPQDATEGAKLLAIADSRMYERKNARKALARKSAGRAA